MEKVILNRDTKVEGNKAVITETTETTLELFQVENQIRDVKLQKERLIEQNKFIIAEFNKASLKEMELTELVAQLKTPPTDSQKPEIIE